LTEAGLVWLDRGRTAFNRGDYFHAHELWEEVWRELADGERSLMQGLIQIAAGLHHLQQRRPRPAAAVLRRGLEKISQRAFAPPVELQVGALARDVAGLLDELEAPGGQARDPTLFRL
jgi:hypothetical protein